MRLKQTVVTAAQTGNSWLGIPGIERTPKGRLLVTWFSGGAKEPCPENTVYLQTSSDGFRFDAPQAMAAPEGDTRAFDSTLWLDPRGRLWLLYNEGNARTGRHEVVVRLCSVPDQPVLDWSAPMPIDLGVPYAFRLNKPTVLTSGLWLLPVTWAHERTFDWFAKDRIHGVGISPNQGKTWTMHGEVATPMPTSENMIVEKRDGSLLMYIRAGDGRIWSSLSKDQGLTWSPAEPTAIPNPGARFFIRQLKSRRWLLINTPHPKERKTLYACLSEDEGVTWSSGLLLDERDQVSYPDATQAEDGTIYAVHDRCRGEIGEVVLSVFTENDVLSAGTGQGILTQTL